MRWKRDPRSGIWRPHWHARESRLYRAGQKIRAHTGPITDHEDYRWRADDGDETGATWLQLAGVDIEVGDGGDIGFDVNVRLRHVFANVGDGDETNFPFDMEAQIDGGGYFPLTASSSQVRDVASSVHVSDGNATTEQIGGTGTFYPTSENSESMSRIFFGGSGSNHDIPQGRFCETEIGIIFVGADLNDGELVEVRMVFAGVEPDQNTAGWPAAMILKGEQPPIEEILGRRRTHHQLSPTA